MPAEALDANAAQRRYWNTVAGPRWVASPGFRERRDQESLALLLTRLSLTGGESVLEIGCGTGALTLPLAEAVGEHGRVVAVDISEPMLSAARQKIGECRLRNVTLHSGDAQVFPFAPAAFDLATSRMGVMFFADPPAAFRNSSSRHIFLLDASAASSAVVVSPCALRSSPIAEPVAVGVVFFSSPGVGD